VRKNIKTVLSVVVVILTLFVSGCSTPGANKKTQANSVYTLINTNRFPLAMSQLDALYAVYAQSKATRTRLVDEMNAVVTDSRPEFEFRLQQFLQMHNDRLPSRLLEGTYLLNSGFRALEKTNFIELSNQQILEITEMLPRAELVLLSVLEEDPNSYLAHMQLGRLYGGQAKAALAYEEFEQALALVPDSFHVWDLYLFYSRPEWGGSHAKMQQLLGALEIQASSNSDLRVLRGSLKAAESQAAIKANALDDAKTLVFQALDFGPHWTYYNTAKLLQDAMLRAGDQAGSCEVGRRLLKSYPNDRNTRMNVQSCS